MKILLTLLYFLLAPLALWKKMTSPRGWQKAGK